MATDQQYQDELSQGRAIDRNNEETSSDNEGEKASSELISFPWGIFFIAVLFDLIGIIPILNIFTELLAGLLLWFWQKHYSPKEDPLLSLFTTKIIDVCTLGIFPSNIGFVIIAYMKKRASSKSPAAETGPTEPVTSTA